MLQLEQPHINVISKIDLIHNYKDELDMKIEYYTEVSDLHRLRQYIKDHTVIGKSSFSKNTKAFILQQKYHKLHKAICELIHDFNLVSFIPLDIQVF